MHLFENSINPDVLAPISANILSTLDEQDDDLLFDPFVLRNIIFSNCDEKSAKVFVKRIITNNDSDKLQLLYENSYINEVLHAIMHRINKAFEKDSRNKTLISKLLTDTNAIRFDLSSCTDDDSNFCVDEHEVNANLELIKAIPLPHFEDFAVLETMFAYMLALMVDLNKCELKDSSLLEKCENIIFGIAQSLKLSHTVIGKNTVQLIIKNLNQYDKVFSFCLQGLLRNSAQSDCFGDIFGIILENLDQERYIRCATVFLEHLDRYKRGKLSEELKNNYDEICRRLLPIVQAVDGSSLTEAYAYVLKWCLFKKNEDDLQKLLPHLDEYVDVIVCTLLGHYNVIRKYFFQVNSDDYIRGSVLFLSVIVKNKSKCLTAKTTIIKIWEGVNRLKIQKEYNAFARLVALTVQQVPEDEFSASCAKLLAVTVSNINYLGHLDDHLKIWTSISSASLSNAQIKAWQNMLEILIYKKILPRLQKNEDLSKQLTRIELSFLENSSLPLSSSLLEAVLMTVSLTAKDKHDFFVDSFNLSLSLLESLIKNRKTLVVDFIPMYMQRYRKLLNHLCINSDRDSNLSHDDVQNVANCSHKFEKLTKSLVAYERDLSRICPNIIADILKQFEQRTIYSNVKVHLNNCLYLFLSLCDEHSVSYLKCVLSTASTEMFKVIYENYNRFYKFTGKV
ncbi:hypothetical protein FQR65_LT16201 [Abscondita terminalis]|nr:hypothetical protein FQR65_LT16201 [Abscondita terminalis]